MEKNKVTLFTTHCPQCRGVEMKLDRAGIKYNEFTDVDAMIGMGITNVPVLSVDGELFTGVDIYHKIDVMAEGK